jgi:hypothetical protein
VRDEDRASEDAGRRAVRPDGIPSRLPRGGMREISARPPSSRIDAEKAFQAME